MRPLVIFIGCFIYTEDRFKIKEKKQKNFSGQIVRAVCLSSFWSSTSGRFFFFLPPFGCLLSIETLLVRIHMQACVWWALLTERHLPLDYSQLLSE